MANTVSQFSEGIWVVKDGGGKVLLKAYTPKEEPPETRNQACSGDDYEYSVDLAKQCVRHARRALPKGTFNNQMEVDGQMKYLTDGAAPKVLASRAETMFAELSGLNAGKPKDHITQMAARCLATMTVGGGVCSLLTYVTAGFATMLGKRGTKIAAVFDSDFNHEYCVLYYGTSPWIVADPWVGTSYAVPWKHGFFPQDAIHMTIRMEIAQTMSEPFGIEFADREVQAAIKAAKVDKPIDRRDVLHPSKQGLGQRHKYQWFHMDGAYAHPDNVQKAHKSGYTAIAEPDEWGDAVTLD